MPAGRPKAITKELEKTIANLFFLCFTDEQVAFYVGLSRKTIQRARAGEFCPAIKRAEMAREASYRQRTWDGAEGWQGAAWNLERKYPTQYSKPEIQLAITNNTLNQTVNNTLVVTAEAAGALADRVRPIEARVEKLFKARSTGGNSHPPPAKEI